MHPAQRVYQDGRQAQRAGDRKSAELCFALAAEDGHPTATRLYKALSKKTLFVPSEEVVIDGVKLVDVITIKTDPELAASLACGPLTAYPPLATP